MYFKYWSYKRNYYKYFTILTLFPVDNQWKDIAVLFILNMSACLAILF